MGITVAVVEDLEELREGLREYFLLDPEITVLGTYRTAEEAIQFLPAVSPDIVIMDINLPGMNGIECIRKLKGKLNATQFMMFTVYENDEKVFEALKAGATGYILKSTSIPLLIDAVKELHQGASPMSGNIARKVVVHFQQGQQTNTLPDILSVREKEVLRLLAKGLLYKEISAQLSLSTGTVRQHIHNIYEKLHVQNRMEAVNKAFGKV